MNRQEMESRAVGLFRSSGQSYFENSAAWRLKGGSIDGMSKDEKLKLLVLCIYSMQHEQMSGDMSDEQLLAMAEKSYEGLK
jgi:hypothetical protein